MSPTDARPEMTDEGRHWRDVAKAGIRSTFEAEAALAYARSALERTLAGSPAAADVLSEFDYRTKGARRSRDEVLEAVRARRLDLARS